MDKSGSRESPAGGEAPLPIRAPARLPTTAPVGRLRRAIQEISREVRQLMEDGNVATSGSEITHSPTGEQNGLRDAQGKLTRRRGDAEEVPEV